MWKHCGKKENIQWKADGNIEMPHLSNNIGLEKHGLLNMQLIYDLILFTLGLIFRNYLICKPKNAMADARLYES